jgi:translation initiation factor IF-2
VPIRIYALAKELQIDSKELVEFCTKAGITGKGSALASLDDDEVSKVRAFIDGSKGASPAARGVSVAPPTPSRKAPPSRPIVKPPTVQKIAPPPAASTPPAPPPTEKKPAAAKPAGDVPTREPDMEEQVPVEPVGGGQATVETPEAPPTAPEKKVAGKPSASRTKGDAESSEATSPTTAPTTAGQEASPDSPAESHVPAAETPATPAATQPPTKPAPAKPASSEPAIPPLAPRMPAPSTSKSSDSESPAFTRDDYISAGGGSGKVRVLGGRSKTVKPKPKPGDGTDRPRTPKPRAPVIHVAQMPEVKQPTPAPKANEPAPQKPDIRLPQDAIASAKAGTRPPLEHLTAKADKKKPAAAGGKPAPVAPEDDLRSRGRGKKDRGTAGKDPVDTTLAGMASARADRQKSRRTRQHSRGLTGGEREDDNSARAHRQRMLKRKRSTSTAAPRKGKVSIEVPCTVRGFCEATGVSSGVVLGILMRQGVMVNINSQIDEEMVEFLAVESGIEYELKSESSLEETLLTQFQTEEDDPALLEPRPPIVTFLGHVDHGKTSLLDYLIGINVVQGEAGGITQHIRAYQIKTADGRRVSFVDTPGHEAFTEMRARGANVTDIAVLVIAADDGIMPQTEEAISHAQAAGVPIVVAMNKMDLPGANPTRVLTQMTEHGMTPSEWGGDVEVVRTSAISGEGMDELLETLLTIAELNDYRANPNRAANGVCLEAEQHGAQGVMAKLVVQSGTLNVGDVIVCGSAHGRIKAIYDTLRPNQRLKSAGPSVPVNVTGFDSAPEAGEMFYVLDDIAQARELALQRTASAREANLSGSTTKVSFERFQELLRDGRLGAVPEVSTLNLIIRADVRGSVEAIVKELDKLEHPEVQIRVLLKGVGGVTVGDVHLADASDAVIVGFNVTPDESARTLADDREVEIRRYDVIYKLTDDLRAMLEGRLKPEERVVELGRALVKQIFPISRVGTVAGCYVVQGAIERNARIRVFRDGRNIGDYPLDSLKREKEDVREVPRGMECGIKLSGFNDVKKDDILEAYKIEEVARTL